MKPKRCEVDAKDFSVELDFNGIMMPDNYGQVIYEVWSLSFLQKIASFIAILFYIS